jgi:hypothetical protein
MRYVHIPVTYAEVSPEQRAEIARAVRDLAGPVYIHCHHGKHRGPAAAASAAVALGYFTPAQGVAFMKTAGTAESYPGLYACVATARPATAEQLDAASAEFPSNRRAHGLVAAMVEVDAAFEHLEGIRAAGWTVPADQPDLVPAAEAGRLADNLRYGGEDPRAQALGTDFMERLNEAIRAATALESGLVSGASGERLETGFGLVQGSCRGCHARYRDGAPE